MVLGQGIDAHVAPWALEAGDVAEAETIEGGVIDAPALALDDEGHDLLAPLGVGAADHRRLQHRLVAEQHLLDLARIDVAAAADDHVPDAVLQRDEPGGVEGAGVAHVEPAAAQGLGRRLRIAPVPGHDHVAAGEDLPRLSGGQVFVVPVHHPHLDPGARKADRGQPVLVTRVIGHRMVPLREPGDGHRRLALGEELVEPRTPRLQRAAQIRDVHRTAAVGDGLQVRRVHVPGAGGVHQAREHRRRGEEAHPLARVHDRGDLVRREVPTLRNDVARRFRDMRQRIQPRAVGERRRMDEGVAGCDVVDVREVGHGHGHEHAVGQDRAFRPAGGAAGVEQPCGVGGLGVRHVHARAGGHRLVGGIVHAHHGVEGVEVAGEPGDVLGQVRGHEAEPRPAVVEDPGELVRMELRVDRDRDQARVPRAEQDLEELRAVGHRDRDARSGRTAPRPQRRRHRRGTRPELAVGGPARVTDADGLAIGFRDRRVAHEGGEVHGRVRARGLPAPLEATIAYRLRGVHWSPSLQSPPSGAPWKHGAPWVDRRRRTR